MRTAIALLALYALSSMASTMAPDSTESNRGLELVTVVSDQRLEDIKISSDDRLMVTHDRGFAPRLWDLQTMQVIALLSGHPSRVRSIEMPDEADRVLTRSDEMVRIWNVRTGVPLATWSFDKADPIAQSAVSRDGKTVAVGFESGRVVVASAGETNTRLVGKHSGTVASLAFNADGTLLVSGAYDKTAFVWDLSKSTQKLKLGGHTEAIAWVEVSRDGRDILTTALDGTARLWDATTGIQRFSWTHTIGEKGFRPNTLMAALLVGSNQELVATCGPTGLINLHSRKDGTVVRTLSGYTKPIREIRRTRDGLKLATHAAYDLVPGETSLPDPLKLWDVATGSELPFRRASTKVFPTAGEFAGDGSAFWIGYDDGSLRRHQTGTGAIENVTLSATASLATAFQVATGNALFLAEPVSWNKPVGARFFIDASAPSLERASYDGANMFDEYLSSTGRYQITRALNQRNEPIQAIWDYSKNAFAWGFWDGCEGVTWANRGVAVAYDQSSVHLFDMANQAYLGEAVPDKSIPIPAGGSLKKAWASPDLTTIVLDLGDSSLWVMPAGKPKELRKLEAPAPRVGVTRNPRFTGDSKTVFWADSDAVAAYSLPEGTLKWRFDLKELPEAKAEPKRDLEVGMSTLVPGGAFLIFQSGTYWVLLDAATGKLKRYEVLPPFTSAGPTTALPTSSQFTPDGQFMIDATSRGGIIRHVATGKVTAVAPSVGSVLSATFSTDGRRVILLDSIQQVSIFEANELTLSDEPKVLRHLGNFIAMRDKSWLVMDAEGRYDASDPSKVSGASYVLRWPGGLEPIDVAQLKSQFYEPNLLRKLLGVDSEPKRSVPDFEQIRLYPTIKLERSPSRPDSLRVLLSERDNGGIGTVRVFVNGKQVDERKSVGFFNLDLKNFMPLLIPEAMLQQGQKNVLEVTASNAKGDLTSRPTRLFLDVPATLKTPDVNLYMLAVGVGDYVGAKRDLQAPPADAKKIAEAIERTGGKLLPNRIHIQTLTTGSALRPTRQAILNWFTEIGKRATSSDIIVVFLAGHGTNRIGDATGYFFLTADADPSAVTPGILDVSTISDKDLSVALSKIAASKQVIILDTCHSGAATDSLLNADRSVSGDYARAYESIREASGTYILAGAAADQLSYESTNVEHGMLTYSLLEAIDRASPDGLRSTNQGEFFLDVERWLGYAAGRVESLKNEVGISGVQRPEFKRAPQAQSFDIGVVTAADRGKLGLKPPRPIVILGNFDQDEEDPLNLEREIAGALKLSDAVKTWTDIARHPGVYRLAGSYVVAGPNVTIRASLQKFDRDEQRKTIATRELSGPTKDLSALAVEIRTWAEKAIAEAEAKKL